MKCEYETKARTYDTLCFRVTLKTTKVKAQGTLTRSTTTMTENNNSLILIHTPQLVGWVERNFVCKPITHSSLSKDYTKFNYLIFINQLNVKSNLNICPPNLKLKFKN